MSGDRSRRKPAQPGEILARERVWEAVIALVAIALFARTVGFGWVYDDQMEIVRNPFIQSLVHLPRIFSTTVWAGSGMETYLYRPFALLTYSVNFLVSGLSPWSYHLVNVLLHAGTSLLVFRVGRLWGLSAAAAGLGGLLFAIHPVHVEVVAAVFGRKDLLAAFFTLAMVLSHGPAVKQGGWRWVVPVTAFACAMLSKEVGVVGIALVATQDWVLAEDRSRLAQDGRRARLYVAYMAVLLAYVLVRNGVTGGVGVPDTFYMDNPLVVAPLGVRLATALVVIGKGLALQVIPLHLSPDYSFNAIPLVRSPLDGRLLGAMVLAGAVTWGLWRTRIPRLFVYPGLITTDEGGPRGERGSPTSPLFLATAWYVITLLPSSNILVTVGTIFGERLLYLPSVAFCLMIGAWLGPWFPGNPNPSNAGARGNPLTFSPDAGSKGMGKGIRALVWAGAALWIGAITAQTLSYSGAWDNDITLFRHAVTHVPNSTKANHKLGEELLRAGELGAALPFLRRALEIAPDNEFAATTLAAVKSRLGQLYLPGDIGSSPVSPVPPDPEILHSLGQMSRDSGKLQDAEAFWEAALASDSTHVPTHADLGALRLIQGDTASALAHLRSAVQLEPGMAGPWFTLGRIFLAQGKTDDARRALGAFMASAGSRFPDQVRWAREALSQLPGG